MYPNLNAEMSRKKIEQKDLAKCISKGQDAISLKMNGKRCWLLDEVKAIRNTFFPNLTIEYLFKTQEELENE